MLKSINLIKKSVSLNSRDYKLILNKSVGNNNFENHQLIELNLMEDGDSSS